LNKRAVYPYTFQNTPTPNFGVEECPAVKAFGFIIFFFLSQIIRGGENYFHSGDIFLTSQGPMFQDTSYFPASNFWPFIGCLLAFCCWLYERA